VKLSIEFGIF